MIAIEIDFLFIAAAIPNTQRITINIPGKVIMVDDLSIEYGLKNQSTPHKIIATDQDKAPVKDDHVLIEFVDLSAIGLNSDHCS